MINSCFAYRNDPLIWINLTSHHNSDFAYIEDDVFYYTLGYNMLWLDFMIPHLIRRLRSVSYRSFVSLVYCSMLLNSSLTMKWCNTEVGFLSEIYKVFTKKLDWPSNDKFSHFYTIHRILWSLLLTVVNVNILPDHYLRFACNIMILIILF